LTIDDSIDDSIDDRRFDCRSTIGLPTNHPRTADDLTAESRPAAGFSGDGLSVRIVAPAGFRRIALVVALALVALELAAFWFAGRLTMLAQPDEQAPARVLATFVLFWSLLTLQAMLVAAAAWTMVALSRTTLTAEDHRITLEHPWRRWEGRLADLVEVSVVQGWLHVRPRGRWRTWHLRLDDEGREAAERLRPALPPGTWLEPAAARRLLLRRALPPLVAGALAGAAATLLLNGWLN
jgi:hypothetical protein